MYLHVRAYPGARQESVTHASPDHLIIHVREHAERNEANRRIVKIIQGLYPGNIVRIINGHHSPSKLISVYSKDE